MSVVGRQTAYMQIAGDTGPTATEFFHNTFFHQRIIGDLFYLWGFNSLVQTYSF